MLKGLFLKTFVSVRWLKKWTNRRKLQIHQDKLLAEQRDYMLKRSPYFKEYGFTPDFQMDKAFMMANFDQLNTVGIKKEQAMQIALKSEKSRDFTADYDGISVGLSSGTSGNQGLFLTSPREQTIWAATILAKLLPKRKLFGHRIAFFLRSNNNLYQSVNLPVIHLKYFDMQIDLKKHIEVLNNYQPTLLVAPASILLRLAKAKQENQLQIQPIRLISVAEILEEQDKRTIQKAFGGQPIHQVYQATEGFLGVTCQEGVIHLNEDAIIFEKEWIDDKRFYPIITDCKRQSQPFIRYRLNDMLQIRKDLCTCGSALQAIQKIEGRSDDIYYLKNKEGQVRPVYPDFIRRCFLEVSEVEDYQASQLALNRVAIGLSNPTDEIKKALRSSFDRFCQTIGFQEIDLVFTDYKDQGTKKLRRIKQEMLKEELRIYNETIKD